MPGADERWSSGDPLSADRLNRIRDVGVSGAGTPGGTGGDGFSFSGGGGYAQRSPQEFWLKLTGGGTSGAYAWVEQVADGSGTWVDGTRTGTAADGPAVEASGNDTLPVDGSARVFARRLPGSLRLTFQMGLCG